MTRRARRRPIFARRRRRGGWLLVAVLVGAATVATAIVGARQLIAEPSDESDPGPVHVHALGVNPADGSFFIATHTGLFRLATDAARAERVSDRRQDTMGFTVVGPDRFLGSGHPDLRDDLPPLLGLIESRDAGLTWRPISLQGKVDFHALRASDRFIVGYDASSGRVLVSTDRGGTWRASLPPEPLIDIAVGASSEKRLLAAGGSSLYLSRDGGRTWRARKGPVGLLAWPRPQQLFVLDVGGRAWLSPDGGLSWRGRGRIGTPPAAFLATGGETLFAATHEGTILGSADGGMSWTTRSEP